MKRINLPLIADTVFTAIIFFIIAFTATRFYTKSAFWGLFIGIPSALLGGGAAFAYISGKQNMKYKLSKDEREKRLLSHHLALCNPERITALFLKLLGQNAKVKGKNVYYENRVCYFIFQFQPLNMDEAAKIIKSCAEDKLVYCNAVMTEATELFKEFNVEYIDINGIYPLLKDADLLPENYKYDCEKRQKFTARIKMRFNKKLCFPLFWSGLTLTLLSYFTFYPVYYIVSGGILLALSATAILFGKKT